MTTTTPPSSANTVAQAQQTGRDRRRFPRYDVEIPVFLRKKTGDMRLFTADVSRHGAFIRTDQPHPLRQLVQLRFRLPDHSEIDAMCMVARWLGPETSRGPGMGVDFFALSKDAKNAWERFLGELKQRDAARGFDVNHTPTGSIALPVHAGIPMPAVALAPAAFSPTSPMLSPPSSSSSSSSHPLVSPLAGPAVAPLNTPIAQLTPAQMSNAFAPPPAIPTNARGTTPPTASRTTPPTSARDTLNDQRETSTDSRPDWMEPTYGAFGARREKAPSRPSSTPVPEPAAAAKPPPPPPPPDEDGVVHESSLVMLKLPERDAVTSFIENEVARGGMFLKTLLIKEVGEKIEIVLVHPDTDEEFHLDGTVVRRVLNGPVEQRGLGIFFRALSPEAHGNLLQFADGGVEVVELAEVISQRQLELESAVAREPDNAEALEALGSYLLDEEGDLGGALTALSRALIVSPSQVSIHAALARAYRKVGDHVKERAHERVAEALMLHQDRLKVRLGVGAELEPDDADDVIASAARAASADAAAVVAAAATDGGAWAGGDVEYNVQDDDGE